MNEQMGILAQIAIDIKESEKKINAQIKELETTALKIGVVIDEKIARKAIEIFNKQQTMEIEASYEERKKQDEAYYREQEALAKKYHQEMAKEESAWIKEQENLAKQYHQDEKKRLDEIEALQQKVAEHRNTTGLYLDTVSQKSKTSGMSPPDSLGKTSELYKVINDPVKWDSMNTEQQTAHINALEMSLKRLRQEMSKGAADKSYNDKMERDRVATAKLDTQMNNLVRRIENYEKLNKRLEGTTQGNDLQKLMSDISNNKINLTDATNKFSEIQKSARAAGLEGKNMWENISGKFFDRAKFLINAAAIEMLRRSFKQMIDVVKEIDLAMTELKKVTDETDATYKRFLDGASDRAQKIGATISDTVRSSANFAKMGYDLSDSATLGDISLIYKNVGDGINDIDEASTTLISTMKAFRKEASDAMGILDVFNHISNKYAVTSKDMGLAMADAGAALHTSGNSLEESIALWTAMNEVIQDGSKSSTALRTLTVRLRNTKGELEGMGEDAEGAAESVTKLQERLHKLTGVNIMASATEFKDTYQILQEISKVWDKITDKDRADVISLVGGVRQASTLSALMSNFTTAEEVLADAANSAGSALKENAIWLDSIEGRTRKLQATFQDFAQSAAMVGAIKTAISALEGVLKNIVPILTTVTGLLIAKKWLSITKFFGDINKVSGVIGKLTGGLNVVISRLGDWKNAWEYAGSFGVKGAERFSKALKILGMTATGTQVAIAGVTLVLTAIIAIWQHVKRSAEEARQAALEVAGAFKDQTKTLDDARQKLNDETASREILISTLESVNSKYKDEVAGLQDVNDVRKKGIELLDEEAKARAEETKRGLSSEYETAKDFLEGRKLGRTDAYTSQSFNEKEIDRLNKKRDDGIELSFIERRQLKYLTEQYAEYKGEIEEAEKIIESYETAVAILNGTYKPQAKTQEEAIKTAASGGKSLSEVADIAEDTGKHLKSLTDVLDDFKDKGKITSSTLKNLNDSMGNIKGYDDFLKVLSSSESSMSDIQDAVNTMTENYLEQSSIIGALTDENKHLIVSQLELMGVTNAEEIATVALSQSKVKAKIDAVDFKNATVDEIDALYKEISALGATEDQLGYVAAQKILAANPNFANMTETERVTLLAHANASETAGKWVNYLALQKQLANTNFLNTTSTEIEGLLSLATAAGITGNAIGQLARKQSLKQAMEAGHILTPSMLNELEKPIELTAPEIKFEIPEVNITSPNGGSGSSPYRSELDSQLLEKDRYYDINNQIIASENEILRIKSEQDNLNENEVENAERLVQLYNDEVSALSEKQRKLHALNEARRIERGEITAILSAYGVSTVGEGDSMSLANYTAIEERMRNRVNSLRDSKDKVAYTNAKDEYDKMTTLSKRFFEIQLTDLPKTSKEWFKLAKEINKAGENIVKTNEAVYDSRLSDSKQYIEDKNFYDNWGADNEIDAWNRVKEYTEQYYKDGLISHEKYVESISEIDRNLYTAYRDNLSDLLSDMEKHSANATHSLKKQAESYDYLISRAQALVDAQQKQYDTQSKIRSIQKDINAQMAASKASMAYLDEDTRKLLFNEDDYKTLSSALTKMNKETEQLHRNYARDISNLNKDNWYLEDAITKEYERRLAMKEREYELAKKQLDLNKKQQELDNILAEKNVRMLVGGQWIQVANMEEVRRATEELVTLEEEMADIKLQSEQQQILNRKQAQVDMLSQEQAAYENRINKINEKTEQMSRAFENYLDPVRSIGSITTELAQQGIPQLSSVVDSLISILGKVGGVNTGKSTNVFSSATSTLLKTLGINSYAGGTTSAKGGLSLVGEEGPEFRILNSGDAIIPADITKSILEGKLYNPVQFNFMDKLKSSAIPNIVNKQQTTTQSVIYNFDIAKVQTENPSDFVRQMLRQAESTRPLKRNM